MAILSGATLNDKRRRDRLLRIVDGGQSISEPPNEPPHNIEAEQGLLSAILTNNEAMSHAAGFLQAQHFYDPLHQEIYAEAAKLIQAGMSADAVTLRPFFENREPINGDVTVPLYLGRLRAAATIVKKSASYARTIYDLALRRSLLAIAESLAAASQDMSAGTSPDELASEMEARICAIRDADPATVAGVLEFASDMTAGEATLDVVKGLLPAAGTVCVYGPSSSGKTFVALDIAHCIARGTEFMGRSTQQGAVLYVALEGQGTIARRFIAAREQHGDPGRMLARLRTSGTLGTTPDSHAFASRIITAARLQSKQAGAPVRLIVIDTLAQALCGENENEAVVVGAAVGHACRIATETGATVLFLHHPGKDRERGMRGSSALFAACDAVIEIERKEEAATRTVVLRKMKDGVEGPIGSFRLPRIELGCVAFGDPITSCVVEWLDSAPKREPCRPPSHTAAGKALLELEHLVAAGRGRRSDGHAHIPDGTIVVGADEWRDVCRESRLSEGGDEGERKAFQRARQNLSRSGFIAEHNSCVWLISGQSSAAPEHDRKPWQKGPSSDIWDTRDIPRTSTGHDPGRAVGQRDTPYRGYVPLSLPAIDAPPNSRDGEIGP